MKLSVAHRLWGTATPFVAGISALVLLNAGGLSDVHAETIYRCGSTYTNQPTSAACQALDLSNITVIEGTKVYGAGNANSNGGSTERSGSDAAPVRSDATAQKERDSQAQQILQTELQKAQTQQADLQKQLQTISGQINQAHQDDQARAHQQALQQALERSQADVSALERELVRVQRGSAR